MTKEKMKDTNSSLPTASVGPASAGRSSATAGFNEVLINKVLDKLTGPDSSAVSKSSPLLVWVEELIKGRNNVLSEDELGEILYKHLWGRRFLIESIDAYEKVMSFFPNNNNGSRIMITTRLSNLAFESSSSHVLRMQFLDMDKSWNLFCEIVFGKLDCPNELEKIGKEIVRNCRGLPLLIVVIGGLLKKSKGGRAHWEYTLQKSKFTYKFRG
ncbi:hypothetical protein ACS0TY_023496 [Phlomoides rotata]